MTKQNKKSERPDAVPASLSAGAVEPKYKKGDHVWAKQPKELAGRTGYVMEVDTYRMIYVVRFGTELWKILESDLELVDPSTEEVRQTVFEREDDADQPQVEAQEIAADVLRALGWEVEINEKDSYWNLVLTNTTSSEDMPESHKSCLRGLLRGWLMEFNFEGGRQQVNIYKELHGLNPEDDRYSCLDTCVNRTDGNMPQSELNDREIFIRRKDRFDRDVLAELVSENITTKDSTKQEADTLATINNQSKTIDGLLGEVAQAKHNMERMKKENDANYQQAVGCLDAVKAMLELSQGNGATHRMRDFYGESIIKFIDSARQKLAERHDAAPIPF